MPTLVRILLALLIFSPAAARGQEPTPTDPPRPDFNAPAAELIQTALTNPDFDHGPRTKEYEAALAEQVALRPAEFAAAAVQTLPDGYRAFRALREQDEAFAGQLRPCRALPHLARFMPPEIASPLLSSLQRRAGMIFWCFAEQLDRATEGRLRAGNLTPEDQTEHESLELLAFQYMKVQSSAEEVAAVLGLDISPTVAQWPGEPIDIDKRNRLITLCIEHFNATPDTPVGLSLEEFFDGNTQHTSIAPNLWFNHPGIECFRHSLEKIRARPEVLDVRISVHEWPTRREAQWIAAEMVFIWARGVGEAEVAGWVDVLRPDGVGECPRERIPSGGPALEPGVTVFSVGWD